MQVAPALQSRGVHWRGEALAIAAQRRRLMEAEGGGCVHRHDALLEVEVGGAIEVDAHQQALLEAADLKARADTLVAMTEMALRDQDESPVNLQ